MAKHTDVLPCSAISDGDAPYDLLNVRLNKNEPRFKYMRDERQFSEQELMKELEQAPFILPYGVDDPNEKLSIFNALILEGKNYHAPVKNIKVTRHPALWIHDPEIRYLQQMSFQNRIEFHNNRDEKVLKTLPENEAF